MTNEDVGRGEGKEWTELGGKRRERDPCKQTRGLFGQAIVPFTPSRVTGQPESCHCSSSYSSAG